VHLFGTHLAFSKVKLLVVRKFAFGKRKRKPLAPFFK